MIHTVLESIRQNGMQVFPTPTGEILVDQDDLVFYEVAMEKQSSGARLVTGNQKHYPPRDFVVTPGEMLRILDAQR